MNKICSVESFIGSKKSNAWIFQSKSIISSTVILFQLHNPDLIVENKFSSLCQDTEVLLALSMIFSFYSASSS